jgi:MFS family permease
MNASKSTSPIAPPAVWTQVIVGALLMLATLPGRSQGLGLITEPLLADLHLSRGSYAQINLWATLGGALACLPAGAWLDRCGLRAGALVLLPALAIVVFAMSGLPMVATTLFILVLLTRALGQGAMSVLSLAVAGRAFRHNSGAAAGVYAVLLSVLFAIAFIIVGGVVHDSGWRIAWRDIGIGLLVLMPLAFWLPSTGATTLAATGTDNDLTLAQCARLPAFWAYSAGIAAFAAISSATGLFNQALLAERGFDQKLAYQFLAGSALIALLGQMICGAGMRWLSIRFWLGGALILQAAALATFKFTSTTHGLWALAALMGLSGGIITVAFFAIWGDSFGKRHLGRIQGAAQTCTVLASALGPLLLERGAEFLHGYANTLMIAAPVCVLLGLLVLTLRSRPSAV